jgi:hypothetical protein
MAHIERAIMPHAGTADGVAHAQRMERGAGDDGEGDVTCIPDRVVMP